MKQSTSAKALSKIDLALLHVVALLGAIPLSATRPMTTPAKARLAPDFLGPIWTNELTPKPSGPPTLAEKVGHLDTLGHILDQLVNQPAVLYKLLFVSKTWYRLAVVRLHRHVTVSHSPYMRLFRDHVTANKARMFSFIETLELCGHPQRECHAIANVYPVPVFSRLKKLILRMLPKGTLGPSEPICNGHACPLLVNAHPKAIILPDPEYSKVLETQFFSYTITDFAPTLLAKAKTMRFFLGPGCDVTIGSTVSEKTIGTDLDLITYDLVLCHPLTGWGDLWEKMDYLERGIEAIVKSVNNGQRAKFVVTLHRKNLPDQGQRFETWNQAVDAYYDQMVGRLDDLAVESENQVEVVDEARWRPGAAPAGEAVFDEESSDEYGLYEDESEGDQ